MKKMEKDVWLILAKVEAVGVNPGRLAVGSKAVVQCFIPETVLENALVKMAQVLSEDGLRRKDVLRCNRFGAEEHFDEGTPEFLKRDVLRARSTGKPFTGTFFTSKESASFQKRSATDT